MQLSIIIVNYNVKHFLEQCLFSVLKAMELPEGSLDQAEIIVIDNNSSDNSIAYLQPNFRCPFYSQPGKPRICQSLQPGLKISTGKYVLFLNPDTIVPEDCFQKCIAFLSHILMQAHWE